MYPKKDGFSSVLIETTHSVDSILEKELNTAADRVESLLIFHCILDN